MLDKTPPVEGTSGWLRPYPWEAFRSHGEINGWADRWDLRPPFDWWIGASVAEKKAYLSAAAGEEAARLALCMQVQAMVPGEDPASARIRALMDEVIALDLPRQS